MDNNDKKFFERDMKIKETLLKLAPTEIDDFNEESRIKYTDKLYKELENLELEFAEIMQDLTNNSKTQKIIKEFFDDAKESILIGKYEPGVIQKLYKDKFFNMNSKLIEDVEEEFCGYRLYGGNIEKCLKESKSINELLHVFHSYLTNNDRMIQALPVNIDVNMIRNSKEQPKNVGFIKEKGNETK